MERISKPQATGGSNLLISPLRLPGRGTAATNGRLVALACWEYTDFPVATEKQAAAYANVLDLPLGEPLDTARSEDLIAWCGGMLDLTPCRRCKDIRIKTCSVCGGVGLKRCEDCACRCQCKCEDCAGTGKESCSCQDIESEPGDFCGVLVNRAMLRLATPIMSGTCRAWINREAVGEPLTFCGADWTVKIACLEKAEPYDVVVPFTKTAQEVAL